MAPCLLLHFSPYQSSHRLCHTEPIPQTVLRSFLSPAHSLRISSFYILTLMLRHRQPNLRQNGFYQNLDSDSTHRLIYNDVDASGSVGCMSFLTKLFTRSKDTTAKSQPAPEMTQTTTPPPRSVPPPLSTGAPLVKGKKIPTVTLNNGVKMPMLGFGTYGALLESLKFLPHCQRTLRMCNNPCRD